MKIIRYIIIFIYFLCLSLFSYELICLLHDMSIQSKMSKQFDLHDKWRCDDFGDIIIEGMVKNKAAHTVEKITLKAKVYNKNGNLMDILIFTINIHLKSRETTNFEKNISLNKEELGYVETSIVSSK